MWGVHHLLHATGVDAYMVRSLMLLSSAAHERHVSCSLPVLLGLDTGLPAVQAVTPALGWSLAEAACHAHAVCVTTGCVAMQTLLAPLDCVTVPAAMVDPCALRCYG